MKIFFLSKEFVRWGIIGVLATIIHYGIYLLLKPFILIGIAYTIGYIISFFCNYYLNCRYNFKKRASLKNGIGFSLSHFFNYILQIVLLKIFVCIGLSEELAPLFVYVIVVPINFLLVRFVFKSN